METLHVYKRRDEEFRYEHFYKRIIHYHVRYKEFIKKKRSEDIFLDVEFDALSASEKKEIPPGITHIGVRAFQYRDDIPTAFLKALKETAAGRAALRLKM